MEKALLVTVKLNSERDNWVIGDIAQELEDLVLTCGAEVVDSVSCFCDKPTPNLFIGKGKAEEIALLCQEEGIDTVIFSHDLSGTHQRNLEEIIGRKTIDRTQLILDIFSRHARSPEGKMQIELAQLQYLLPRLVGKGIMLSRLGGGIGTRGPGEQKLEVDRRCIRKKIDKLKDDLRRFSLHRLTMKKRRKESAIPAVVLVGYTNAGKSTLLNALTGAGQTVANSLFTTLDPLSKSLVLPGGEHIVVSDTVGFLHGLPHGLIDAFKATLEEVADADLLIHVVDVSHPRACERARAVFSVLKELGADKKPMITALNKVDLLDDKAWLEKLKGDFIDSIPISAKSGENIGSLSEAIGKKFEEKISCVKIIIPSARMDLVGLFYREGKVEGIKYTQKGIRIEARLPKVLLNKLLRNEEIRLIDQEAAK